MIQPSVIYLDTLTRKTCPITTIYLPGKFRRFSPIRWRDFFSPFICRAGKPPTGLHLDVMKDDKMVQKLMIDEKKCYLFGRNPQMNDFCIDHASCSRVHAAFVYHKHLNIAYLVDLGSTHGTYIGSVRLEAHKPTQLQINSIFHFGASTRFYMLRERPNVRSNIMEDIPMMDTSDGTYLGLPESQTELDVRWVGFLLIH